VKAVITDANSTIGRLLREQWYGKYEIIAIDQHTGSDVTTLDFTAKRDEVLPRLKKLFVDADAIIHLVPDIGESSAEFATAHADTISMGEIVLSACVAARVGRIICASSVEVSLGHILHIVSDNQEVLSHDALHPLRKISVQDGPRPSSLDGVTKASLELLGFHFARTYNLHFIATRLGVIYPDKKIAKINDPFGLSESDCVRFFEKCLVVPQPLDKPPHQTFTAVSGHGCCPMNLYNEGARLKYVPKDVAPCPFGI
jgi:nucleoside-diphosphate-sugar epimerase